eukprot:gene18115-19925_t
MSETGILINIIASAIFAVVGTFGNVLVIVAFFSVRSLRTINNMFVLQLAFVDLMKASIILTTKSINLASGATSMDATFCQLSGMFRTIGSCQSAVLLATIAVVRYFKVCKPRSFNRVFTLKKTLAYCAGIFGGTLLLALMPVIGLGKYRYSKSHGACFVNWDRINLVFRSIYYLFNVGITFPVLIFCYLNIFLKLREHSRAVTPRIHRRKTNVAKPKIEIKTASPKKNLSVASLDSTGNDEAKVTEQNLTAKQQDSNTQNNDNTMASLTVENGNAGVASSCSKQELLVPKKSRFFRFRREKSDVEQEVTRVMFAIVVAYIVCWMPAFLINILHLSKAVSIPSDVLLLIVTLVDLKVCVNPLIYGIGSKQFRNAFLAVLRRRFDRDSLSVASASGPSKIPTESSNNTESEL